ncbi:MAG: type II toxin-antitoxin system PemK/MazF family toxin [Coleofasciculaceae cyanobacterium]
MAGKRPRQGWIYFINPYRVSLRCRVGHTHLYDLNEPGEFECKHASCKLTINSSRVFRGEHPHIIWTSDQFQDDFNYIQTFTVIPLTCQETYKGLPTVYPINSTSRNGLDRNYFALVHQLFTVDANCFQDSAGNWSNRIGQLDKGDKEAIEKRLQYFLNLQDDPGEDWFVNNAFPGILKKVFEYISEDGKETALERLLDDLDW